eukprot:TRINITY_DN20119_c1_g1_i1.p2 TRINITY_DN20119_c1_g1~~TRINITY_DN20119_c1_g1_i1.p2  ORF type:complete len:132 (-),score=1.41 TRINITY_DN20119_c1_g1_i1:17-412(-)
MEGTAHTDTEMMIVSVKAHLPQGLSATLSLCESTVPRHSSVLRRYSVVAIGVSAPGRGEGSETLHSEQNGRHRTHSDRSAVVRCCEDPPPAEAERNKTVAPCVHLLQTLTCAEAIQFDGKKYTHCNNITSR